MTDEHDSTLGGQLKELRLAPPDPQSWPDPTPPSNWPDPTPAMLRDTRFQAIWQRIKSWDINVPEAYAGYCGATGNHVRAILDAIAAVDAQEDVTLVYDDDQIHAGDDPRTDALSSLAAALDELPDELRRLIGDAYQSEGIADLVERALDAVKVIEPALVAQVKSDRALARVMADGPQPGQLQTLSQEPRIPIRIRSVIYLDGRREYISRIVQWPGVPQLGHRLHVNGFGPVKVVQVDWDLVGMPTVELATFVDATTWGDLQTRDPGWILPPPGPPPDTP